MYGLIQSTSMHVEVQKESKYKHEYTLCVEPYLLSKR
jgi:hypothetical protein